MFRIARQFVVRPDENFSTRDGDIAVTLRTDLGDPAKVFDAVRVDVFRAGLEFDLAEGGREIFLRGIHVAQRTPAPFGPVSGRSMTRAKQSDGGEQRESFHCFNLSCKAGVDSSWVK